MTASYIASPATERHIGEIGGRIARVSAELTRPADTTAYAANDAVSNSTSAPTPITITNAARVADRGGYIVGARLMTNQAANTAAYRLHLFHTQPSAINDNAAHTVLWANRASRIGVIDITLAAGSTAAFGQNFAERIPFDLPAAGTSVWALLETRSAFTPVSAQVFYVELLIDQT